MPDFATEGREEIVVTVAAVAAENELSDEINNNRHHDEADEKKTNEKRGLPSYKLPETRFFCGGNQCGP